MKNFKYYYDQIVMPGSDPSLLCPTSESAPLSSPAHFGGTSPGSRAKRMLHECNGLIQMLQITLSHPHWVPRSIAPGRTRGKLALCIPGRNFCGPFLQVLLFSVWGEKSLKRELCVSMWFLFFTDHSCPLLQSTNATNLKCCCKHLGIWRRPFPDRSER